MSRTIPRRRELGVLALLLLGQSTDAQITMVVAVADRKQMERVMGRIRRIKGVRAVDRSLS